MNLLIALLIIAIIGVIVFLICSNRKKGKHALKNYASSSTVDFDDSGSYQDELDYFMTPVTQATRIENNPVPDKKKLYNKYNEAVVRYNKVSSKIRKHPKVPNIETIIGQRDKVYREMMIEQANARPIMQQQEYRAPRVIPVPAVAPPVPVLKENKREDRLKIQVKSSAQNVHDHNVNDELSNRYKQIKASGLPPGSNQQYAEMIEFIDQHNKNGKITDGFKSNTAISRFDNDPEDAIWSTVWRRIHAPENTSNVDSLKNAFRDAVVDCTENNNLVCTTGRVTRVLDSLTLLDSSLELSKPTKTDDLVRKETYDQAHQILQRELDSKGSVFKVAYESGEMEDTDTFDTHVKECMKKEIISSKYLNDALAAI
jgi:hypothetical protein